MTGGRPSGMRFLLSVLVAAGLVISGCGSDTTPTARESSTPTGPPTWPATGCTEHSMANIDYASDAAGQPTREGAAAAYMEKGDRLVRQERQPPHQSRGWVVVTHDNQIRAIVTMYRGSQGFLVDSAEKCSG
jgi:hypothetical protein